jgi:hypothetical protein
MSDPDGAGTALRGRPWPPVSWWGGGGSSGSSTAWRRASRMAAPTRTWRRARSEPWRGRRPADGSRDRRGKRFQVAWASSRFIGRAAPSRSVAAGRYDGYPVEPSCRRRLRERICGDSRSPKFRAPLATGWYFLCGGTLTSRSPSAGPRPRRPRRPQRCRAGAGGRLRAALGRASRR